MVKGICKFKIKELYQKGLTGPQIANILNCNSTNIYAHLKRMGISSRKFDHYRKFNFKQKFFKCIDTEEKAYILGFLYADGYNQETKNQIRITLHRKDEDILIKIKKSLKYNKPLFYLRDFYVDLSFNSKTLSKDLSLKGCMQNKSDKVIFPSKRIVPKHLIRHFIRGYFDGDGSIYFTGKDIQISVTSNIQFLTELQEYLEKELDLNRTKLQKKKNSYMLFYHGRRLCTKILKFLYSNSGIALNRKKNIYKKIVSLDSNIKSKRHLIAGKPLEP